MVMISCAAYPKKYSYGMRYVVFLLGKIHLGSAIASSLRAAERVKNQ